MARECKDDWLACLEKHAPRIFDILLDLDQELDCFSAIEQAVVVSQSKIHHGPDFNLVIHDDRALLDSVETQHSGLREIDDGRAHHGAEYPAVADCKCSTRHVLNGKFAVACLA